MCDTVTWFTFLALIHVIHQVTVAAACKQGSNPQEPLCLCLIGSKAWGTLVCDSTWLCRFCLPHLREPTEPSSDDEHTAVQ